MAGSFESVDFSVRKNKSIQRKLISHLLETLQKEFDISDYQYVGMGSLWFVDFVLFHKRLGLRRMISIQEPKGFARAQFNAPFDCIKVRRGLTTTVLPTLNLNRKTIAWLDYDEQLGSSICDDLDVVLKRVRPGSLCFVSVRAELKDFGGTGANDETVESSLREQLGSWIPRTLPSSIFAAETFPAGLADLLHSIASNLCAARFDSTRWHPLLSYYYNDGTRMLTIGGMLCDADSARKLSVLRIVGRGFYTGKRIFHIAAPQLTSREKASIDAALPTSGMSLRKSKLTRGLKGVAQQYAKYYLYYPVFWELSP
jgi:hypothetical protein